MARWSLFAAAAAFVACAMAHGAAAQTHRTGDRIDGTDVIDRLDAQDLPVGQVHRFWFRASDTAMGQGWYVPVIVVRGAQPGPRLLLTAAIHGDELNGIDVIHQLAAGIDPARLSGTLVMIPGLNTPGILHHSRGFTPGDGRDGDNLNRIMPGKTGPDASIADIYADRVWTGLMRPNADAAIDLHTQSRGTAYVFYAFAANPRARAIAEAIGPDILKLDPGVRGTVELEMIRAGIPAITLELERPEMFDPAVVSRARDGIMRVMVDMQMLPAGSAPPRQITPFVGNKLVEVSTTRGGYAHILVPLNGAVTKDQVIATISDPFGRTVETIRAPESGRVNTIATDPLRDAGSMVLRIVYQSDDPACREGC